MFVNVVVWWFGGCQIEGCCWRGKVGLIWELCASSPVRPADSGPVEVGCDWTRWPCGGCQIGELRAWVRCSKAVAQWVHCCRRSSALSDMANDLPVDNRKPPIFLLLHIAERGCDFFKVGFGGVVAVEHALSVVALHRPVSPKATPLCPVSVSIATTTSPR